MNLPNKLTVLRLFMVPLIIVVMLIPVNSILSGVLAAIVFGLTAFTDMLDGKIARKNNLVTDFGKFLDPLADKFMVITAMVVLTYKFCKPAEFGLVGVGDGILALSSLITTLIVIMRELAVTSIRLVASNSGVVVPANILGKIKTCTQIAFIEVALLEPVFFELIDAPNYHILTYVLMFLNAVSTVWSGINYLKTYWKYLDPQK